MRNIKIKKKLVQQHHWPKIGIVSLKADSEAQPYKSGVSQEVREEVIQSWKTVAVMKVTPQVPFRVGFMVDDHAEILADRLETKDGHFGMRLGDSDVKFFVMPEDLETELKLEVVETVKENDPKYEDLPLY